MSHADAHTDHDPCLEGAGGVDCAEVFEKLDLILDGELPTSQLAEMQGHLAACVPCAERADFESQLRAIVRERCTDEAPPGLIAKIRQRLELPTG